MEGSDNRRIAHNSLMLYIRMFVVMLVGFYISRVVLDVLGNQDYGLYGVVCSVVAIFASLNLSMRDSSIRFLTYSLGKKDSERLKVTFDSIVVIHFRMAALVLLIAESVGLWYVNNKLVFPSDRILAANIVYQSAVFSLILSILQMPYFAAIIAYERMKIYAYIDILNIAMKLIIVFLLYSLSYDSLICYAILMFAVSVVLFFSYKIYAQKNFAECRFERRHSKSVCKEIFSFLGFNTFGTFGNVFNVQAINILINKFFGLIVNAANGVATNLSNTVNLFTSSIMMAFTPPITKAVAEENSEKTEGLITLALKMSLFFFALFAIPVVVETEAIMDFWLVEVPPRSEIFARLIIGGMFLEVIRGVINTGIFATGKVKFVNLCVGGLLILNSVVVWIVFKYNSEPALAYLCALIAHAIIVAIVLVLAKRYVKGVRFWVLTKCVLQMIAIVVIVLITTFVAAAYMPQTLWRVVVTAAISTILLFLLTYIIALSKENRNSVKNILLKRFGVK